ncbi:MAG: class I SAM-dependent methyltransferase [Pseudomonadota bacterium]
MKCRVCDSQRLEPVVDLGMHPWGNHFLRNEEVGKEPFYPLRVVYCHDCSAAQLDYTVKKEVMFGDHTYLSGTTKSLSDHFYRVAKEVDDQFFSGVDGKSVLDIGSNDGTQLKHYKSLGYNVLGVESSKMTARIANEAGIATINDFFNSDVARQLERKFHIINASGVFFHLEELHSVTDGIRESLRDDGVFVVQFLYMKRIVENLAFDQIYHEHLLYYTLETIETLLNRHGLAMFDAYVSPIHGGSVIGYIGHRGKWAESDRLARLRAEEHRDRCNDITTYQEFSRKISVMRDENRKYLFAAKKSGKRIYGMGAPVKGNTLLNYFGIGPDVIECLTEKNELRRGLCSPGMHIPIVMEDEITRLPDIYYVLAWNFKTEILKNNQELIRNGVEFYFPVNPKEG